MLNETRQNISTKESLLFCILGGVFVYGVAAIPRILYQLFPPEQPKGGSIYICFSAPPIPNKYSYLIGFSLFTILGIYLLKKLNLKNRLVHFSFLGLILAIGGGILTSILEFGYYLYIVGDSDDRVYFLDHLKENWFDALLYDVRIISWAILFLIILIPFTVTFLTSTSIIKKFAKRNSLR
ncbi:MAG TPA: hypothetical protein PKY82_19225 [Pyrinomonadaceae bacterium]|nr:hypothetical protein [Pyrinomonadaceae bacterium]